MYANADIGSDFNGFLIKCLSLMLLTGDFSSGPGSRSKIESKRGCTPLFLRALPKTTAHTLDGFSLIAFLIAYKIVFLGISLFNKIKSAI